MKFTNQLLSFYNTEHQNLCFDEDVEPETDEEVSAAKENPWTNGLFANLITAEFESSKSRGLHRSARGEQFTVPVFMGSGWVDLGYEFAKGLAEDDKDLLSLVEVLKEKNTWVSRTEPRIGHGFIIRENKPTIDVTSFDSDLVKIYSWQHGDDELLVVPWRNKLVMVFLITTSSEEVGCASYLGICDRYELHNTVIKVRSPYNVIYELFNREYR